MKVSRKFACPNVFILLCDHGQRGGVLKLKTDDQFEVIFAVISKLFYFSLQTFFYSSTSSISLLSLFISLSLPVILAKTSL